MQGSTPWGRSRSATLLIVLLAHVALLAVLLTVASSVRGPPAAATPLQLVYLPPVSYPRVRAEGPRPRRLQVAINAAITPPQGPPGSAAPAPGGAAGKASGVDWSAEARRALQAMEIRYQRALDGNSTSPKAAADNWWPEIVQHHAGDRYKTPSGDWIVWISANCYQVATAGPSSNSPRASLPETACVDPASKSED